MHLTTRLASLAVAAGLGFAALVAPQQAEAGIQTSATLNGNPIPSFSQNILVGTDPFGQLGNRIRLSLDPTAPPLLFADVSATQQYLPATATNPAGIELAQANSTTLSITNLGDTTATLVITVVFDSFRYPGDNPLLWSSQIATSGLSRATFTSTEVLSWTGGSASVAHSVLGSLTNPSSGALSETIAQTISPSRPYMVTQTLTVTIASGGSANIQKTDNMTAVPEPASLALLGAGLLGLAAVRRSRRRADA